VALEPGEDIKTSSPAESGSSYEPFQYRTLLQVSAALGIPYAVLTNDMVKANYSNTRSALVEFRRRVEAFQHAVMVFLFCRPVIAWFMDLCETSGSLSLPGYEARRREYVTHSWLPPKFDWVDPWKDAKAEIEQINSGLKSRSQAIAERGYDAETIDEEIARDKEREQRLGLVFGKAAENSAAATSSALPIEGGPENGSGGTAVAGQETTQ
jgi:lambda family phage portal protein